MAPTPPRGGQRLLPGGGAPGWGESPSKPPPRPAGAAPGPPRCLLHLLQGGGHQRCLPALRSRPRGGGGGGSGGLGPLGAHGGAGSGLTPHASPWRPAPARPAARQRLGASGVAVLGTGPWWVGDTAAVLEAAGVGGEAAPPAPQRTPSAARCACAGSRRGEREARLGESRRAAKIKNSLQRSHVVISHWRRVKYSV